MSVCVILDMIVYLQAKLKKKQEAANAKILEAEKRIKVCVCVLNETGVEIQQSQLRIHVVLSYNAVKVITME